MLFYEIIIYAFCRKRFYLNAHTYFTCWNAEWNGPDLSWVGSYAIAQKNVDYYRGRYNSCSILVPSTVGILHFKRVLNCKIIDCVMFNCYKVLSKTEVILWIFWANDRVTLCFVFHIFRADLKHEREKHNAHRSQWESEIQESITSTPLCSSKIERIKLLLIITSFRASSHQRFQVSRTFRIKILYVH